jgi:hypothetical protein
MLSAVITALLLVVMLLIITSLLLGARREHQRHKRRLESQVQLPAAHAPEPRVTAALYMQDGNIVAVEPPKPTPAFTLPASWYRRGRTLVSLGLLVMILLAFCLQDGLAGGGTLRTITKSLGITILGNQQAQDFQANRPIPQTASALLVRVDSAAHNQYHTDYQWQVWAYSSCSGIAMEMVMNAYGRHLIAADVLEVEDKLGVWNTSLGLLREDGIGQTANYFGFNASLSHSRTVQDVVAIANKGNPVIVSVRDSYYYPNGHIFVVRGGDNQYVYIADSSPANFQRMSYQMFQGMWQGFSAVLTPK